MIDKLFKQTQDEHGIANKELATVAGISSKHLCEFRNGKTNITLELLWQLVEAMDRLSPGARRDFGLRGCWLLGRIILKGSGCGATTSGVGSSAQ